MSDAPAGRERRIFWASLAVLLVAVPAALALRGYDSALAWRANQELYPLVSEPGKPLRYGAAEWRLEGLYQLIGQDKTSAYILHAMYRLFAPCKLLYQARVLLAVRAHQPDISGFQAQQRGSQRHMAALNNELPMKLAYKSGRYSSFWLEAAAEPGGGPRFAKACMASTTPIALF